MVTPQTEQQKERTAWRLMDRADGELLRQAVSFLEGFYPPAPVEPRPNLVRWGKCGEGVYALLEHSGRRFRIEIEEQDA